MKPIFEAFIPNFKLIPNSRPRLSKGKTYNTPQYTKNQNDLQWILKSAFGKAKPFAIPMIMSFTVVYNDKRVRDLDNCLKAICDALEKAGVLKNDRFMVGCDKCRIIRVDKTEKCSVMINLFKLEE